MASLRAFLLLKSTKDGDAFIGARLSRATAERVAGACGAEVRKVVIGKEDTLTPEELERLNQLPPPAKAAE